jgi:hypothetical protein
MEQMRLPFDKNGQQTWKFYKLKKQVEHIQENMTKLAEAAEYAQCVMRKNRNELSYELQKECHHQSKPYDWNNAVTFYCPDCGKPL